MTSERHQTWENFQAAVMATGGIHPIPGSPPAWVFAERGSDRVGVRIAVTEHEAVPPCLVAALDLRQSHGEHGPYLELSCKNPDVNRQFYSLALDVTDAVQLLGHQPGHALTAAIAQWEQLLKTRRILGMEQQIGLFGELWLLRRLAATRGSGAIAAWMGPRGEPHDFRWGDVDVEVKATTQASRVHIINGLTQLESSPGRRLFILSLQIQPAGSAPGTSLVDAISELKTTLDADAVAVFESLVAAAGYQQAESAFYTERWSLRTPPALVPVNQDCPRLLQDHVETVLGPTAARVSDVHYRVNLDGLGWNDPSDEFRQVIR